MVPKHTRDCFPQLDASLASAACVYRLNRPTQQTFHCRVVSPVDDRRMAFSRSVRIGAVSEQLAHLEQHFPEVQCTCSGTQHSLHCGVVLVADGFG